MRTLILSALILSTLVLAPRADAAVTSCGSWHEVRFEDDPCWNWVSMGNHSRGVVTINGTPLVVGPCRFQRLVRLGHLAPGNERMRGDFTARHTRCHPRNTSGHDGR